jgi:hypothetical protein
MGHPIVYSEANKKLQSYSIRENAYNNRGVIATQICNEQLLIATIRVYAKVRVVQEINTNK